MLRSRSVLQLLGKRKKKRKRGKIDVVRTALRGLLFV